MTETTHLPSMYQVAEWMLAQGRPIAAAEVTAHFKISPKQTSGRLYAIEHCPRMVLEKTGEVYQYRYHLKAVFAKDAPKPQRQAKQQQRAATYNALLSRRW